MHLVRARVVPSHTPRFLSPSTTVQLRLAQLGGVDLQGHLSKFNPDAAEQGIFSQDWELRYFVLSGEQFAALYQSQVNQQQRYSNNPATQ